MKKITQKWFSGDHPVNADYASVSIGAGDNGVVTVTATTLGTEENSYTIEVVEGVGSDVDLSATFEDGAIIVTLGTDVAEALDDTKNTATLIANAIEDLDGVSAEASGTGATPFQAAVAEKSFTGGSYATVTHEPAYIILEDGGTFTIYGTEYPVGKYDTDKWKTGTITTL